VVSPLFPLIEKSQSFPWVFSAGAYVFFHSISTIFLGDVLPNCLVFCSAVQMKCASLHFSMQQAAKTATDSLHYIPPLTRTPKPVGFEHPDLYAGF